jgi:hypothetical protein
LFRDPAQRSRVFASLLAGRALPAELGGPAGPTPEARVLAKTGSAAAGERERIARVAVAIWSGEGSLPLGDVLSLPEPLQEAYGSLLMAIGLGHAAIDRWLAERDG